MKLENQKVQMMKIIKYQVLFIQVKKVLDQAEEEAEVKIVQYEEEEAKVHVVLGQLKKEAEY